MTEKLFHGISIEIRMDDTNNVRWNTFENEAVTFKLNILVAFTTITFTLYNYVLFVCAITLLMPSIL